MYQNTQDDMSSMIQDEKELVCSDLATNMDFIADQFRSIDGGNFMLFNQQLDWNNLNTLKENLQNKVENVRFTQLLDFTKLNTEVDLQMLKEAGVHCIKFHSYVQQIFDAEFERIIEICKIAEKLEMPICVDASYGTNQLYDLDNLKLVASISQQVQKTPIIILHSGGARIFDAMLIAESTPNVFLETSFSMEYYKGSSIEKDILFAYKKLGSKKVLYASDAPALGSLQDSIDFQLVRIAEMGFNSNELDDIFFNNAINLF